MPCEFETSPGRGVVLEDEDAGDTERGEEGEEVDEEEADRDIRTEGTGTGGFIT